MAYMAVLFAPDGDFVTDYRGCESIAEVEERLADQGSRWFFYPLEAVIRDTGYVTRTKRLVSAAWPIEAYTGRQIGTLAKDLADMTDEERAVLLNG